MRQLFLLILFVFIVPIYAQDDDEPVQVPADLAQAYCAYELGRLPTIDELQEAYDAGVYKAESGQGEWVSTDTLLGFGIAVLAEDEDTLVLNLVESFDIPEGITVSFRCVTGDAMLEREDPLRVPALENALYCFINDLRLPYLEEWVVWQEAGDFTNTARYEWVLTEGQSPRLLDTESHELLELTVDATISDMELEAEDTVVGRCAERTLQVTAQTGEQMCLNADMVLGDTTQTPLDLYPQSAYFGYLWVQDSSSSSGYTIYEPATGEMTEAVNGDVPENLNAYENLIPMCVRRTEQF